MEAKNVAKDAKNPRHVFSFLLFTSRHYRRRERKKEKAQDTVRLRANYVNGRKGTFSYILDRLHALNARHKCARRAAGRIDVTGGQHLRRTVTTSSSSRLVTRKGAITRAQDAWTHISHANICRCHAIIKRSREAFRRCGRAASAVVLCVTSRRTR